MLNSGLMVEHAVYENIRQHIHNNVATCEMILTSGGAGNKQRSKLILT